MYMIVLCEACTQFSGRRNTLRQKIAFLLHSSVAYNADAPCGRRSTFISLRSRAITLTCYQNPLVAQQVSLMTICWVTSASSHDAFAFQALLNDKPYGSVSADLELVEGCLVLANWSTSHLAHLRLTKGCRQSRGAGRVLGIHFDRECTRRQRYDNGHDATSKQVVERYNYRSFQKCSANLVIIPCNNSCYTSFC